MSKIEIGLNENEKSAGAQPARHARVVIDGVELRKVRQLRINLDYDRVAEVWVSFLPTALVVDGVDCVVREALGDANVTAGEDGAPPNGPRDV